MKIIFLEDVKGQGKKDEIKEVKDGYATFLINSHKAVSYTEGSAKVLNKQVQKRHEEEEALVEECNKIRKKLENKNIKFKVKTGQMDRVFGSVSTKQISEKLTELGYNIDKKKINLDLPLNTLGIHNIKIILHKQVEANLKVTLK